MKVLLLFSLLVIYASAEYTLNLAESFEPYVCACNVSASSICMFIVRHEPIKTRRFEGYICHDDPSMRIVDSVTEYTYTPNSPTPTEAHFIIFQFYRPYTFVDGGQTISIQARTVYVYQDFGNNDTNNRCYKFSMFPDEQYHKFGIPSDYYCVEDITEGWLNAQNNDGVHLKLARKESSRGTSIRTVTKNSCFPVRHDEFKLDSFRRVEIMEETTYYESPNVAIPILPSICRGI
ncbi:hypothetical protein LOD99_305 [Oopsacas minuta]|uniref:Uncharacterized protein n=1 Tax=Oopsacas minuta TaxID=111878 RepID=A0AAV7K8G1_9METZ|nr:hypothetical protein LOD99_305 [Oopsacas minuta]